MDYELLDSGNGEKFERFGSVTLVRPCSQALWSPQLSEKEWGTADAYFTRAGGNQWKIRGKLPEEWVIEVEGIRFKLKRTDFGHLGIFPEQALLWKWIQEKEGNKKRVLNLFAYSGGSSMAAALSGATVYHLDAARGMVAWAKENAALNDCATVHWLVDDAMKYLMRAERRGEKYDAIIFDPPTFGRGKSGEVFKIEEALPIILKSAATLLSDKPSFLLFTCHTPGYTPIVCKQLLQEVCSQGNVESGEMVLEGKQSFRVPCGTFARWSP